MAWAAVRNVGVRCGPASGGLVVIDADPGADLAGLDLPPTVEVLTGRPGGRHFHFRCADPIGNSAGKLGPHIDVKATGGQVVYAGSVHPETGRVYRWRPGCEPWNVAVAELPGAIVERLNQPDPTPVSPPATPRPLGTMGGFCPYGRAALEREADAAARAVAGARNNALNKSAYALGRLIGGGLLDRPTVEAALLAAAEASGLLADPDDGEHKTRQTIRGGIEAGMKRPRHVLASGRPGRRIITIRIEDNNG